MKNRTNIDLKNARILICNDDGINAKGIEILEDIARSLCDDVWVVAPEDQRSGYSHAISLLDPMTVRKRGEKRFAISGTPADCVLVGIGNLLKDKKPDLILSGINNGSNIAEDILYSGTIGVCVEAIISSIPTIAFSQRFKDYENPTDWSVAEKYTKEILEKLVKTGWNKKDILNVNYPCVDADKVKGVCVTRQAFRTFEEEIISRKDPRGQDYVWFGHRNYDKMLDDACDINQIENNKITITPLTIDLTSYDSMSKLKEVFED